MRFLILLSFLCFSFSNVGFSDPPISSSMIKKDFQLKTTANYFFSDKEINIEDFFKKSKEFMSIEMLKSVKEKLHHAKNRENDYPNICHGFIRFYYLHSKDQKSSMTFKIDDKFISGGHYFDEIDSDFKNENKLRTSFDLIEDLYGTETSKKILKVQAKKRGIELGKFLEKKINNEISGGAWRANCHHSEALFFLALKQSLKKFFKSLNFDIKITGCTIGISSYYDPCYDCLKLSQGFQWNLKHFIEELEHPNVKVDNDFGTICMISGQVKTENAIKHGRFKDLKEPVGFKAGKHQFVHVASPSRIEEDFNFSN